MDERNETVDVPGIAQGLTPARFCLAVVSGRGALFTNKVTVSLISFGEWLGPCLRSVGFGLGFGESLIDAQAHAVIRPMVCFSQALHHECMRPRKRVTARLGWGSLNGRICCV